MERGDQVGPDPPKKRFLSQVANAVPAARASRYLSMKRFDSCRE